MQGQWESPEPQSIPSYPTLIWPGFCRNITKMATQEQIKVAATPLLLPFLERLQHLPWIVISSQVLSLSTSSKNTGSGFSPWSHPFPLTGGLQDIILLLTLQLGSDCWDYSLIAFVQYCRLTLESQAFKAIFY